MASIDRATEGQELINSESQIHFCPMEPRRQEICVPRGTAFSLIISDLRPIRQSTMIEFAELLLGDIYVYI